MGRALLVALLLSQEALAQTAEPPPPPPPPPPKSAEAPVPDPTSAEAVPAKAVPAEATEPTAAPAPAPRVFSETQTTMGVRTQVQVFMEDEERAKTAIAAAFDEIRRIEELLTEWKPNSDVTRINKAAGKTPVVISAETSQVLTRGKQVAELTGGAFSLTWAALASLWDFSPGSTSRTLPTLEQLTERLEFIDDTKLKLDKSAKSAFLELPGMAVGVGGLAKGYAVHRALMVLKNAGTDDALVFVGGDIGVIGRKGDKPWIIGIQDPRATGFFAVLPLGDTSIATTGDYEQFFELDGKRYHHILDPRTGMPARACRSASIIAGDAVTADALATAVFVMGPTEGMELVERMNGVEAVIVGANNEISMSTGLEKTLRIVRPPSE